MRAKRGRVSLESKGVKSLKGCKILPNLILLISYMEKGRTGPKREWCVPSPSIYLTQYFSLYLD